MTMGPPRRAESEMQYISVGESRAVRWAQILSGRCENRTVRKAPCGCAPNKKSEVAEKA
jgi:hypothetical protein